MFGRRPAPAKRRLPIDLKYNLTKLAPLPCATCSPPVAPGPSTEASAGAAPRASPTPRHTTSRGWTPSLGTGWGSTPQRILTPEVHGGGRKDGPEVQGGGGRPKIWTDSDSQSCFFLTREMRESSEVICVCANRKIAREPRTRILTPPARAALSGPWHDAASETTRHVHQLYNGTAAD